MNEGDLQRWREVSGRDEPPFVEFRPCGGLVEFSQTVGTMHEMTPRPERDDFDSDAAYYAACDQWFIDTHTFTGIRGTDDLTPSDGRG